MNKDRLAFGSIVMTVLGLYEFNTSVLAGAMVLSWMAYATPKQNTDLMEGSSGE